MFCTISLVERSSAYLIWLEPGPIGTTFCDISKMIPLNLIVSLEAIPCLYLLLFVPRGAFMPGSGCARPV
ncbi:hypothetical protein BJX62DRAFT_216269 [Aspergillus germanicus]